MASKPPARPERRPAPDRPEPAPAAPAGMPMPPEQRVIYLEAIVRSTQAQLTEAHAQAAHFRALSELNAQVAQDLQAQLATLKPQEKPK